MSIFVVLLLCIAVINASEQRVTQNQFREWMNQHNKVYTTTADFEVRFHNFQESVLRINEKNGNSSSAKFSLNKFSDLSPSEFKQLYLMSKPVQNPKSRAVLKPTVATYDLPAKFDWRTKNVVSPVKDQGQCGSCWAFSAVENVESVYMLAKNMTQDKMPALSPQQVVDCSDLNLGCNGGNPPLAYEYIETEGLERDSDYPYHATGGTCAYKKEDVLVNIKTWNWATHIYDETLLQQNLVSWAPLSICVDASAWQDYSSGVFTSADCCTLCSLDHCVQLVGYDQSSSIEQGESSTPYWIVRNSWGTDWGIDGYIWLEMGHNTCALTLESSSVVV